MHLVGAKLGIQPLLGPGAFSLLTFMPGIILCTCPQGLPDVYMVLVLHD